MEPFRFYWITSEKYSSGYSHELPLIELLRGRGHQVVPWVWDRADLPPLGPRDRVIVRTPDYFEKPEAFGRWLASLPPTGVHNSRRVLEWNSRKTYLRDLEADGIRIIPTRWIDSGDETRIRTSIREAFSEFEEAFASEEIIVKPVFSAASYDTFRLKRDEFPPEGTFVARPAMIQPFRPEILVDGECSLVYFRNEFSHGVRKRPRPGDFRIQESFGGRFEPYSPSRDERMFADAAMESVIRRFPEEGGPLYGRVDYLRIGGIPHLMEFELFEPDLYFHHSVDSVRRFVDVLESL